MNERNFKTEQEAFWAGEFGDEYIRRNQSDELLASNLNFFATVLRRTRGLNSCIEFGANIEMNLRALKQLHPGLDMHGVEINAEAARVLADIIPRQNIVNDSLLDFKPERVWDLVLIKGVLIHINPDSLKRAYDTLVQSAGRYLLVAEYYNRTPVSIPYRGHSDRLFKRDFAGEILDQFPELALVDYGFSYHRDPNFPQDDITWFLMERG
mgnify:FL=1